MIASLSAVVASNHGPNSTPTFEPETHATESLPVSRWYPKMSPYRVFVITTTIVLGTSKAIFAYRGMSNISTTLEWIAGVVVTLLFFVLDEWESKESYPKLLQRFFTFDCAELIWKTLRVSRPRYRSDESHRRLVNSVLVPLTGYRIVVSATVVVLGSVKAAYAYLGYNTSANSLDWTLAVFITSLIYYIGLYESNPVGLAPNFFVRNYYTVCYRLSRDTLAISVSGISLYICVKWTSSLQLEFKNSLHEFATDISSNRDRGTLSTDVVWLCVWAFLLTMTIGGAVFTLIATIWAAQKESAFFAFLFRRGKFAKFYDDVTDRLWRALLFAPGVVFYVLRTTALLIIIVTVISFISLWLFVMAFVVEKIDVKGLVHGKSIGAITTPILVLLLLAYTLAAMVYLLYYLILTVLDPSWHRLSLFDDDDDDDADD